jgi:hypothetical protein
MSEPKTGLNKTTLSKAVVMALPLLAASGMTASAARNASHSSSRRSARNSVVHVDAHSHSARPDNDKRGVFSAFGSRSNSQMASKAKVDDKALAFLRENGLLATQAAAEAQLSGELLGRKNFASDSPYAHCHTGSGTWHTNTTVVTQSSCVNTWGGTWHAASTKPVVMSTGVLNKTATSFDVSVTMSENSTVFAVLLLSSQPAPTSAQVIAGTDGSGAAAVQTKSQAMNPSGTLQFTGLTSGTNYMVYVVGRDGTMEVSTTPKQVNPAFETGLISNVGNWKFPKIRTNSAGEFYLGQSDSGTIKFRQWNGSGFTDYATINVAGVSAAIPGVTGVYWGNEQRVDFEVDASGNLYVVFNASTGGMADTNDPYYGYYNGTTWSFTKIAETGYLVDQVDVYLDASNHVHASFTKWTATGDALLTATNASGAWVLNTLIAATSNTGMDQLHDTHLVVDSSGVSHLFYRREDEQNFSEDNYYYASSADNYVTKTLILNGKGDQKQYRMAGVLIDDNDNLHYAYSNDTDDRSYYVTNASGSWVSSEITHGSYATLNVQDMQRIDDTFYFASSSGANYFMNSYDGSDWVDGFDFQLNGWLNDRFAISGLTDRIMFVSENSGSWEIHYHSGTIAGYITPAVANNAPTDIALSNSSVNQSGGANATVGTLSTTDADVGDTFTYTLVAGTGDTHNASFNISGSTLRANNAGALAAGNYSVRVQTSDGSATYAEAFTITVADNVAPTVTSVSVPANDTYAPGESLSFTVNTSENITVNTGGGTPRIALTIGSTTRYASYVSGSGGSALVFTYTVQAGDFDGDGIAVGALETNSGTLRDAASNNLTTTLNSVGNTTSVLVDAVPPSAPSTPDLAAGSETGSSSTDNITSDTTPTFTGTAEAGATVTIISSVGGTLGTTTADGSGNWSFTSGVLAAGAHNITATATDGVGNSSTASSALAIQIDTSAASGHSVSFTNSTINASQAGSTSFSFASAEIGASYSYSISSSGGGTAVTGSGTIASISALISDINVSGLGDGTLTLSVVVTDSAGNVASAVTNTATLDATAPTVAITSGVSNPTNAAFQATVTFSETVTGFVVGDISAGNASLANFTDNGGGAFSVTVTPATDGTVTLNVAGSVAQDTAGNNNSAATQFSTVYDTGGPILSSTSPADNATGVQYNTNIALTFSESINVGSGNIAIYDAADDSLVDSIAIGSASISGTTATFDPGVNLTPTHNYYVLVDAGLVEDALGNGSAAISSNSVFNFTVGNNAPSAAADSASTNEDNAVDISVLSNDSDVDSSLNPASVTVASQPTHGTTSVNTGTGVITYTPTANYNGSDSFTYTVSDVHGGTSTAATVTLTVNAVNDNPVAVADVASTPEDTAISIDVTANDSDIDTGDSIDPDTLDLVTQPSNGSAVVSNGEVLYTPAANFNGSDSFTYRVQDQNAAYSNTVTVIVNVSGVNDAPTAANDSATTDEDTAVDIDLVDNDSDIDGSVDATSVTVMAQPANGSVSINAITGVATYTPNANHNGSDSFTYVVQDNENGTSAVATVSITINSVNDAPVATNDTVTLQEDTPHAINVLGNDSDVDGTLQSGTVEIVTAPVNGTTSLNAGVITYTPGENFSGSDSLTYRVQDNENAWSNTATVTITVESVNDEPLANDDSAQTDEDTPVNIDLLGNDSDVDGSLDAGAITIVNAPTNGSLQDNGDGTVTYTPAADFNGSDSFTYTVADNQAGISNTATVSIDVQPVNDAPLISGTPTLELLEGQTYSFVPTLVDVDNLSLTVTAANLPDWLTLNSSTGEISGTPLVGDAGDYSDIALTVSDGTASALLAAFTIRVLGDNDTDGTENSIDTDDDNDGMSDLYEETHGFNPIDPSDAAEDADGDTLSNLQESIDGTSPSDASDYHDVTAPVITAPQSLIIDAVALHTPVTLQQLLGLASDADNSDISAALGALTTDNVDGNGCCSTQVVNAVNNSVLLAPGAQQVTYRATDRKGNIGTVSQTVYVRPLVSVNKDQISSEGATVQFRVILNGKAPFYPFTVPFVIDGASTTDGSDHDLIDGSVTFSEIHGVGETEVVVAIQLLNDLESEGDETLIVRLDDRTSNDEDLANGYDEQNPDIFDINSGAKTSHVITISEQNVAPDANLTASQGGLSTILVTTDGGPVTLTATIADPNSGDTHTLDWSATDNRLVETDGHADDATLVFDPSLLAEGRYAASVTVTDSEGARDTATLYFRVVAALPVLSDQDDTDGDGIADDAEGTGDSDNDGIPDYLDNIPAPNVLPEVGDQTNSYLVECDPGVRCRLGQFALMGASGGVRLQPEDFAQQPDLVVDAAFAFNSGIFDFEMHELPTVGQSVRVVLPQANPIPQNAVYRKFLHGSWRDFVQNADNALHSAPGNPGYCPPPGDDSWEPGLVAGYHCVQLTLQDGGPNDGDGVANASVEDPGGVAVRTASDDDVEQTFHNVKSKGKGGGGSLGLTLLLTLGLLMLGRRTPMKTRGLARAAALGGLLLGSGALSLLPASNAQAVDWEAAQNDLKERSYVSVSFYQAKGSQTSSDFVNGLESDGVSVDLAKYEESRTAWQIATGYRYHDWMAVELGYLDLGESEVNLDSATASANQLEAAMSEHYPISGHGWTLSNRFFWQAMPQLHLEAEVGLYIWEGEINLSGADLDPDIDGGTDFLLGFGASYDITDKLGAALLFKRIFFDDQEVDLIGVEGRMRF